MSRSQGTTTRVSVCICTRGRPDDLRGALASLETSRPSIQDIIVSDDLPSPETKRAAETAPVPVRYTVGPGRGLAANRNHALRHVSSPYVLFIDDDCELAPDFLERGFDCMRVFEAQFGIGAVVVSGAERTGDLVVQPSDQTFLGFQSKAYNRAIGLNSIVINSTIFPTALARRLEFDSRLRFGSEEVDMATRMVAAGATIVYCPGAINNHRRSPLHRSSYSVEREASRLYATLKRYIFTEHRLAITCAFVLVAPLHSILAGLKRSGPHGAAEAVRAILTAGRRIRSYAHERTLTARGD